MSQKDSKIQKKVEEHLRNMKIDPAVEKETRVLVQKMVSHEAFGNSEYKWSIDDFEFGKRLGRGEFGRVYIAHEKKTGFIVALKTMIKRKIVEDEVEHQVMREIEIQSHLKHPNILQLLTWFHDSHRIYLILEYAGKGELYSHLKNCPGGRFPEHRSSKYVYQVADALHYCHQNDVIHRDIKPENLLLTITDDVKLADFGWSVHAPSLQRKTMCGTLDYLPPEMVEGKVYRNHVDNWCLGVLCYEFLTGKPPFESKERQDRFKKISAVDFCYPERMSLGAKDLISRLLVHRSDKRLSLPQVMAHPWVQANKDY